MTDEQQPGLFERPGGDAAITLARYAE